MLAAQRQDEPQDDVYVMHDNWQAVDLFLMCLSDLRYTGGMEPTIIGIGVSALESAMRMKQIKRAAQWRLLQSIRIFESAALRVINKR